MCCSCSESIFGKDFSDSNWYPLSEITFLLLFNFSTARERLLSKVLESCVTQATASCKNLGAIKEPKKQPWKFKLCIQRAKLSFHCAPSEVQGCCSWRTSEDSWTCHIPENLGAKGLCCCRSPLRAGLDIEGCWDLHQELFNFQHSTGRVF